MEDITALSLVREEITNIQSLSNLPDNFQDEKQQDEFKNDCISIIEKAVATINPITDYAKEINNHLEQLRVALNNSTKTVQERLKKTLNSIPIKSSKPGNDGRISSAGTIRKHNSSAHNRGSNEMALALRLQEIEVVKQKLNASIALSQKLWNDIDTGMGATMKAVDNLKGSINDWMAAERDKQKEDQRKRDERRIKSAKEERRKNEADDRRRREKEEQEQNKKDVLRRKESQEKKRKEEERQMKEEEDRVKREEEERKIKIEEERIRKANEERMKNEEEQIKSKYEEEKRLKEEEMRKQREEEETRIKKEEEEARKRQKKKEEDERLREQQEERKRIEEETWKKDPANWNPITYNRPEWQTNAYHRGVCCHVAAMDGILKEEDLECLASDEWREDDKPSMLNLDEKLASSKISIEAKSGEKTFAVPMRVYAPHCSISDSSDEIVVKMSIDGGEWTDQRPVSVPHAQIDKLGMDTAGVDVSKFKTVKMVAVAKTRSQEFVVDQAGTNTVSTVDKNIKLFVPRDTFSKPCKLKLEIRQINDDSLRFATQYFEHCHNVLSTSSVMKITSETATDRSIELDLARKARKHIMSREKGKYLHVYKCRGDSWKIADSKFKGRNMDVSVTLPSRKESYVVMEIEGRPTLTTDEFLKAADELYFHSNASIVRVIAKQKGDDQKSMMIECVGRNRVASRISELEIQGYIHGPDTSKEFSLLDGQGITLKCSGNIKMDTGSEVKLTFHSYMDTAKQEVRLQVVDEFRQKNSNVYLGTLQFEVMPDNRDGAFYNKDNGSLPLTLPKVEREQRAKVRIQIHFPHYLTALAKFLAIRLTTQPKDDTWIQVIYSLDSRPEMDNIKRREFASSEVPDSDRNICELILLDWMKNTPVKDDKVKLITAALKNCQRKALADECNAFVSFHKEYMSNDRTTEMAKNVEDDWESFALTIGLSKEEIDTCRREDDGLNETRALIVLYKWRVSEVAITSGFDVFNDLLGRLENAQSNVGLQKYIQHLLIQMK